MNRIKVLFTYKISSTENPSNIFHTVMFIWFFFQMEIFFYTSMPSQVFLLCGKHPKQFHIFIWTFDDIFTNKKKMKIFLLFSLRKYSLWRIEGICSECINIFMKLLWKVWINMEMPFILMFSRFIYIRRACVFLLQYDMCKEKNEFLN